MRKWESEKRLHLEGTVLCGGFFCTHVPSPVLNIVLSLVFKGQHLAMFHQVVISPSTNLSRCDTVHAVVTHTVLGQVCVSVLIHVSVTDKASGRLMTAKELCSFLLLSLETHALPSFHLNTCSSKFSFFFFITRY